MKNLLHGVLVDVEQETVSVMEIPDELDELYRILNCDCIDIVVRRIGSKLFNIICDDEALLKDWPKISAIDNLGRPMLCGNLFIVGGETINGNLTGLELSETGYVTGKVQHLCTRKFPAGYPMLTQCEY